MVSAFGGDKLLTFFIHDNPPPETYSVMPDFSDHEVSTSFNCVSTHYPSGLEMLAGQMGATIFSWTPTSSGRPFWFAPYSGAVTGCNPNDPSSYAPYMLSVNQTVKWSGTAHEVKSQFIGALNAFAHADRSSGMVYTLLVGNLKWGDVSTMPYLGVSFYTVTFPPAPPTSSTVAFTKPKEQSELRWVPRAYFCPDAKSCNNGGWIRNATSAANDVYTQTYGAGCQ